MFAAAAAAAPHKMGKFVSSLLPPSLLPPPYSAGDSFGREAAPGPPPPFSAFPQSEPGRAGMWSLVIVILQPSNLTHHLHHTHQENQQASDVLAETPCRSRDSNCAAHYKSVSQCELPTPSGISSLSSLPPTNLFSLFLLCSL